MKTLQSLFTLVLLLTMAVGCKNNDAQPAVKTVETEVTTQDKQLDPNAEYAKAEFTVEGMTCAIGCAKTIEKNIAKMEGVKSAKVDFDKKLAMVEFDVAKVSTSDLEQTVKKTGDAYTVKDMKTVETFDADAKSNDESESTPETEASHKTASCKPGCKKSCCSKEAKA